MVGPIFIYLLHHVVRAIIRYEQNFAQAMQQTSLIALEYL